LTRKASTSQTLLEAYAYIACERAYKRILEEHHLSAEGSMSYKYFLLE
jgi:hypothetical protein